MRNQNEKGFTIVEVLMVTAISGLLLTIGLLGQGEVRKNAQFTDALETLEAQIESYKVQAVATANTVPGAGGDDTNNVLFGNLISFSPTDDFYTVKTLTHSNEDRFGNYDPSIANIQEIDYRWGLEFSHICEEGDKGNDYCGNNGGNGYTDGRSACVMYYRNLNDGRLRAATLSQDICNKSLGDSFNIDLQLGTSSDPTTSVTLHSGMPSLNFTDSDGREAVILSNSGTANGSIELIQL